MAATATVIVELSDEIKDYLDRKIAEIGEVYEGQLLEARELATEWEERYDDLLSRCGGTLP